MQKKQPPPGFRVGYHSRGKWRWKREFKTNGTGHVPDEVKGFRSRNECLAELYRRICNPPSAEPSKAAG